MVQRFLVEHEVDVVDHCCAIRGVDLQQNCTHDGPCCARSCSLTSLCCRLSFHSEIVVEKLVALDVDVLLLDVDVDADVNADDLLSWLLQKLLPKIVV